VKRCPTCNKSFTDQQLSFCVDDGTPLVNIATGEEPTVLMPSSGKDDTGQAGLSEGSGKVPSYQPPGSYIPPGTSPQGKRRIWPWVLGILVIVLLVFAGLGIAAAILIPGMMREAENTNATNSNANVAGPDNSNLNANSANANSSSSAADGNENNNANSDEDTTPPPTDQETVLSELKDLEDEWTAANINADKKTLNRILADDYVDTSEGKARGKAEYLKTAQRDTAIQKWAFEDLKVSLKGDRATLSGIIRLEIKDEHGEIKPLALSFTDKFVWRDGRWQATGSEVSPLKE
jgi:ketosteroid isomerase-like protein